MNVSSCLSIKTSVGGAPCWFGPVNTGHAASIDFIRHRSETGFLFALPAAFHTYQIPCLQCSPLPLAGVLPLKQSCVVLGHDHYQQNHQGSTLTPCPPHTYTRAHTDTQAIHTHTLTHTHTHTHACMKTHTHTHTTQFFFCNHYIPSGIRSDVLCVTQWTRQTHAGFVFTLIRLTVCSGRRHSV